MKEKKMKGPSYRLPHTLRLPALAHLQMSTELIRRQQGTPLQYSCLENPMDRGAWWAAVHGVGSSGYWSGFLASTFATLRVT